MNNGSFILRFSNRFFFPFVSFFFFLSFLHFETRCDNVIDADSDDENDE